jgi:hypothetical protein
MTARSGDLLGGRTEGMDMTGNGSQLRSTAARRIFDDHYRVKVVPIKA